MNSPTPHKPHLPQIEDLEPPVPPDLDEVTVELEDGLIAPLISDDPEHERLVDPEGSFDDWPPRATGDGNTEGP